MMDNFTCECPLGRIGSRCEMSLDLDFNDTLASSVSPGETVESVPIPYFNGDSFLHYHDQEMAKK